ncbi:MAG TPA: AbrB/MazE/SpoVT family DNA-binding domain-containing protein [Alphaproteobacteria bacterium]|nr:AbrB/MazE/SpoVT family DNA-binding domain-containing protein [Alphaproteobacteria bacterium]
MRVRLSKWGHSLAVRIPRAFAEQLGVTDGSAIEIMATGERIVLKKSKYTLQGLLDGVTLENLHGETDTGVPVGREEW